MYKKLSTVLALLIVASMVLTACGGAGSGGAIKVGLLAPLSGAVPTFGLSTQEGVQMAVKEWNAKGGILGKQIELIVADSQCSADPAVNAANKLIDQDGVKFIIGEVCSSASIPFRNSAEKGCSDQPNIDQRDRHPRQNGKTLHLPRLLHRPLPGPGDGEVRPG
jgi:branched-chain amino acid transport system substrate-binding protein